MGSDLRLQVALARLGFASRRSAKKLIQAGRVKINGQIIFQPGQRVDVTKDSITVDNKSSCIQKKIYFILNKPKDVVVTVKDRHAGKSVVDLIRAKDVRIYPVGRLDKDTTGLLLLTNDGELTHRLAHPKFGIPKVYRVCVEGNIDSEKLKKLESGIMLEGKKTHPCRIKILTTKKQATRLEVHLTEGRKRQIKKMFSACGHPVLSIERVAFGPLKIGGLKLGQFRPLQADEVDKLKKAAGV